MKTLFMDTVGLLALWDSTDQWHTAALAALNKLDPAQTNFVTTSFVFLECGNAAARRPYRLLVDQMRTKLAGTGGLIIPTDADESAAWSIYRRNMPGDAGIVDQVSFVVMRRMGIAEAFTNDRHFKSAGFITLF